VSIRRCTPQVHPVVADDAFSSGFAVRLLVVIVLSIALCLVAGCGRAGDERGQRAAVRGAVYLDGRPLNRARIVFRTADGPSKVKSTGSIVDGFYEIPAERGPLIGTMRVEVQPETIELEAFVAARGKNRKKRVSPAAVPIPAKYNRRSQLTADVSPDGRENKFDFRLTSQ
jgi:hypothetical protein